MATQPHTGLTYDDLRAFPEDNLRRELIGGELIVTAAPATRHQRVVLEVARRLADHADRHGGVVLPAPTDVYLTQRDVVEPDVLFVAAENADRIEAAFVSGAPDIVVEVSSPSTRRLELVRKRELYERFAVREYWYVDLDADRIEIYRLHEGRYPGPEILEPGDVLTSPVLPHLSVRAADVLALEGE